MKQIEYKKFTINHVYDCSKGYEKLDYYNIWTPNRLDMVAEEFPTMESAKLWINQHIKKESK
tara:strand:+ start:1101 stop:1286 length:186 start_codon:yes stop_codon:yes gene_type:complete